MAYIKNNWVDREGTTRYFETVDDDGALIFTPDYTQVTELGTPVNADNMNHIEEGIGDHESRITVLENLPDKYLNKSQITNCILEAPNGLASYSGSVLTLKSGIKYLTGIGRNKDLSFKTAEYTTESERNLTFQAVSHGYAYVYILNGYPHYCPVAECYFIDQDPAVEAPTGDSGNNQVWFDLWNNEIYHSSYGSTEWVKVTNFAIVGKVYFPSTTSSTISSFRAELPVELLQRKNKAEISSWGMPSSKYIDLTLGASGTYYTAPANGWITIRKFSNGANQYLACGSGINALTSKSINPTGNQTLDVNMPVAKGERFWVSYSVGGATEYFRFIYAQGEV